MHIMAIALGGCLTANPAYGITEDTGGHITYILGAMRALVARDDVTFGEIITRRFHDAALGEQYAARREVLGDQLTITRIGSDDSDYLAKDDLARDRAAFTAALIAELRGRAVLPDIIHAHFADAAEVATAIRRKLGIPFIYTAHSLGIDKAMASTAATSELAPRIELEHNAMRNADAIIGSSRDECERQIPAYASASPGAVQLVRPGIDQTQASLTEIANAQELVAPFLRDLNKPIVLAIARPVKKKNLAALIEAFANSATLRSKANLVILPGLRESLSVGEDEQVAVLQELAELIDQHDLYGCVAYPRKHTQGDVRGLYALARQTGGVFVNPALTEPFGLTILEAAVHGLPVVATNCGGPVDIVREIGHGLTVDPSSTIAIAAAIERILSDNALWFQFSQQAKSGIAEVSWADYGANFMAIANRVILQNRPTQLRSKSARQTRHLLVCDLDNTLTGCRDATAQFARMVASKPDLAFGIATGRSLVEAQRILREWNLPQPDVLITSVGSEIYWQQNARFVEDRSFVHSDDVGWQPDRIDALLGDIADVVPQSDIEQRHYKRSYFASSDKAEVICTTLAEAGIAATVYFSHDRLLDILPSTAGKGAALKYVAKAMSISWSNVIAAGDSGNDLDMISDCANAIVVANAEQVLLALRDRPNVMLTRAPYAGGVIEGLRCYFVGQQTSPLRQIEEAA